MHSETTLNVEAGSLLLADPATGDLVFQIAWALRRIRSTLSYPQRTGIVGEWPDRQTLTWPVNQDKRHFRQLDQTTDF
jgi:hypothetical protein